MAKYVLVYKGGGMAATEQERQVAMAAWGQWFGTLGSAVVDSGHPFSRSKGITAPSTAKDGAASALTGYSVLQADSLDAAATLASSCPIFKSGGTVDVYETIAM